MVVVSENRGALLVNLATALVAINMHCHSGKYCGVSQVINQFYDEFCLRLSSRRCAVVIGTYGVP